MSVDICDSIFGFNGRKSLYCTDFCLL